MSLLTERVEFLSYQMQNPKMNSKCHQSKSTNTPSDYVSVFDLHPLTQSFQKWPNRYNQKYAHKLVKLTIKIDH